MRAQDLKTRLPEDMFGEIREMHPLLTPKLTNATIRRAVKDYLNGGARKQRVVTKYGEIIRESFCLHPYQDACLRICLLFWHSEASLPHGIL